MTSFALGIIYGLYVFVLAIINVVMAWYDNGYQRTGGDGPCGCTVIGEPPSMCGNPNALKKANDTIAALTTENASLKTGSGTPGLGLELPPNIRGTSGYTAYRRL